RWGAPHSSEHFEGAADGDGQEDQAGHDSNNCLDRVPVNVLGLFEQILHGYPTSTAALLVKNVPRSAASQGSSERGEPRLGPGPSSSSRAGGTPWGKRQ